MKKTILIPIIAAFLAAGAVGAITLDTQELLDLVFRGQEQPTSVEEESLGGVAGNTIDVVGSRIGTTTTSVAFTDNSATTTYPILIGRNYDAVEFNIKTTTLGAGGGNNVVFSLLGSNDFDCDTATTSTINANTVLIYDINWFDMGNHLRNLTGSKTQTTGTTTLQWIPKSAYDGTSFIFDGLNTNCLSMQVSASGTSLWIEAMRKDFK